MALRLNEKNIEYLKANPRTSRNKANYLAMLKQKFYGHYSARRGAGNATILSENGRRRYANELVANIMDMQKKKKIVWDDMGENVPADVAAKLNWTLIIISLEKEFPTPTSYILITFRVKVLNMFVTT